MDTDSYRFEQGDMEGRVNPCHANRQIKMNSCGADHFGYWEGANGGQLMFGHM